MMLETVKKLAVHFFLAVVLLLTIVPFLWMFSTSLKPEESIFAIPPELIPSKITLGHYKELFTRVRFMLFFGNSIFVAVCITLLNLILNSLAGYAFAKHQFPGREKIFTLLIVTMMVPGQVAMMPVFLI